MVVKGLKIQCATFFPFCFTEVVKEKEMGGVENGWMGAKDRS